MGMGGGQSEGCASTSSWTEEASVVVGRSKPQTPQQQSSQRLARNPRRRETGSNDGKQMSATASEFWTLDQRQVAHSATEHHGSNGSEGEQPAVEGRHAKHSVGDKGGGHAQLRKKGATTHLVWRPKGAT